MKPSNNNNSIQSLLQDYYLNLSHTELEGNYDNGLIFYQIGNDVCIYVNPNNNR